MIIKMKKKLFYHQEKLFINGLKLFLKKEEVYKVGKELGVEII